MTTGVSERAIERAIFDPGSYAGVKPTEESLSSWQARAVMKVVESTLLEKEEIISELVGALERAAERFREYERLHLEKTLPPDTLYSADAESRHNKHVAEKAARNREIAELCESALSRVKGVKG